MQKIVTIATDIVSFAMTKIQNNRILGLDGIRGIAAVVVIAHHTVIYGHNLGTVAVDVFFLLSGFLIIGIVHKQRLGVDLGMSRASAEMTSFFKKRAARILPIYYVTLA